MIHKRKEVEKNASNANQSTSMSTLHINLLPYLVPYNPPCQGTLDGGILEGFFSAEIPSFDTHEK